MNISKVIIVSFLRNNCQINIYLLDFCFLPRRKRKSEMFERNGRVLGADFRVASNCLLTTNDLVQFSIALFFCENGG